MYQNVSKREFLKNAEAQKKPDAMQSFDDTEIDDKDILQQTIKRVCLSNSAKQPLNFVKDFNLFRIDSGKDKDDCSKEKNSRTNSDMLVDVDEPSVDFADERTSDRPDIPTNINVDGFRDKMQSTAARGNRSSVTGGNATELGLNEIIPEATMSAILTNQMLMNNNQLQIMASLSQLANSVEILKKQVMEFENNIQGEHRTPAANVEFKPVSSLEELDRLEAELLDGDNMKRYVKKLCTICGTGGRSDGVDCAYRLIDYMATREMMNLCSWTGMARDVAEPTGNQAGTSKIPLKFYVKFRELFFTVIRLADDTFSEASCEKFLKDVMKNSKQRLNSKVTSTHKNRPRNLKYRVKNKLSNQDK